MFAAFLPHMRTPAVLLARLCGPIAELLLELGADVSVVDSSGACLLATAAEAGRYGMLTDLLGNMPQVWKCCPRRTGGSLSVVP